MINYSKSSYHIRNFINVNIKKINSYIYDKTIIGLKDKI